MNNSSAQPPKKGNEMDGKDNFEGYPHYPADEDVYENDQVESDIDPDDPTKEKAPNEQPDAPNEKDLNHDKSGADLDVPGAELDDDMEEIGSEDEENNYYSFGQ